MIDKVYELGQQSKDIEAQKSLYLELLKQYAISKGEYKKLFGNIAQLRVEQKIQYSIVSGQKDLVIERLQQSGHWDEVMKEDIDKGKFEKLFEDGICQLGDYHGLVMKEEKIAIGWPMKLKK